MKDRSVECGLATYVQCEFRHPATKTQDPREVHDHDRNITGKDTNPFSEGRETQLYLIWQRKNRSARRKNCRTRLNDANPEPRVRNCAPRGNSHYPNQLN